MNFFNPLAFIGLVSVPIIIIMYLFKQKHKDIEISSISLWQKAIMKSETQQPWQKLIKNILMLLQILIAILLVLAISKPYIIGMGQVHNYIIVLDSSMSMQATDQLPNRFEHAKQKIVEFIDNTEPNSKISLVVMNKNPYTAFNAIENKNTAKNILKDIKITESNINIEITVSILEMLNKENSGNIYIFSDDLYTFDGLQTETILIGQSSQNTAITSVAHSIDNQQVSVLVKVKNYGNQIIQQTLSLFIDGLMYDTKQIELNSYEEKNIIFDNLTVKGTNLEAKLEEKDILAIDDKGFDTITNNKNRKVLLASDNNVFLEKAFSILDIQLYKSTTDNIENLNGYDLYVFDGVLPKEIPIDGHILVINPPNDNTFINVNEDLAVKNIIVRDKNLLEFATDIDFSVKEAKRLEVPEWADIIIDSDVTPLVLLGENNGQKNIIFNFDLHNTDLPLKKEFPIFIYNIVNWYLPENPISKTKLISAEIIEFDLKPDIVSAKVISPNGDITNVAPPFPSIPFSDTMSSGIYTLEQTTQYNTIYDNFAVNVPAEESNLLRDAQITTQTNNVNTIEGSKSIINIFIIIVLIILILEWYLYGNKNSLFKKRLIIATRMLTIILIVLALFNLSLKKKTNETTTIFAVDLSDSTKQNIATMKTFITDTVETKTNNDFVGVIGFGRYPTVENSISKQLDTIELNSQIDRTATDIDKALKLSNIIIPEFSNKRIVLMSDGQENLGNLLQQAKFLKQQNVQLDVYPMKNNINKEVQITEIIVPKYINKDAKVNVEIKIDALNNASTILKLYKNNILVSEENINVYTGENKFVFSDTADMGGAITYKSEISQNEDTLTQNNIAYTYSYVSATPKILILDNNDSGMEIENILKSSGVQIVRQNARTAPNKQDKLLDYSAVILADVSIDTLPKEFPIILESYVKSTGGGLVVTGGSNSYALGGYQNTPIETILPVDMQLKDKTKESNLGMIIVTDRSGSMQSDEYGISKLSLAKEAVIRAVDALDNKDNIGVIAFDNEPQWTVEFQNIAENKQAIQDKIASITSGGGTSILPSLQLAYDTLVNADTKLKHIILLTDGQAETSGYDGLIEQMSDNKITLSTVAVGTDSDTKLLERLANNGNGRHYYSNVFTDLPEIFARETFLAGKTYINNRSFYPKISDYSTIMNNINQLPILNGYIASSEKPRADVILSSDKDDPILATWQYGLGKTAAWTSDMNGGWSSDWIASQQGVEIFRNTVASVLKNQVTDEILVNGNMEGNKVNISADIGTYKNIKSIKAVVISPDMKEYEMELKQTKPQIYETDFDSNITGAYIISIQIENKDGEIKTVNSGVNINYSKEYDIRDFSKGEILLKKAAEITGGRILNSPDEVFKLQNTKVYVEMNITIPLLIIALILFIFDVAVKRLPIVSQYIELTVNNLSFILKDNKNLKPKKIKHKKEKKENIKISTNNKAVSTSSTLAAKKKKRMSR